MTQSERYVGCPVRSRPVESFRAGLERLRSRRATPWEGQRRATAFERGWSTFENGELLAAAEGEFDLLITTDRDLRYQQSLTGGHLAILVLPTTSWRRIERHVAEIEREIAVIKPGEYRELDWSE